MPDDLSAMLLLKRAGTDLRAIRRAAFSLVEVVVAMAIIGVGVIALYAALASGFAVVQQSREDLRSTQIMVELMDTLRLYNWDQITDPTFTPKNFNIYFDPVAATNGGAAGVLYKCQMEVKMGPNAVDYQDDMKIVTLDIRWTTNTKPHTRSFVSYVTRNGLQSYIYY